MVGRSSLLVLALLGGCVCEPDHLVDDAYAPAKPYGAEIDACITRHDCEPLCLSLFALGPDQSIVSCAVEHVDAAGTALVEMRSEDYGVCAAQDDGYYGDDGWGDDGSTDTGDDGSCNDDGTCDGSDDGSTDTGDDGSTDTGDDGSTDDGSTDDGSTDDGSTDDGGDSGDGGDSSDDWLYRPGSTPVKAPAIHAPHVSRARK